MAAVRALSFLEVVLLISRELVSSPVHRPPNSFLLTSLPSAADAPKAIAAIQFEVISRSTPAEVSRTF